MKEEDTLTGSQSFAKAHSEIASVRIMGNLGRMPGGDKVQSEVVNTPVNLGSLLETLESKYNLELRRDSILVIVNGVEARALQDLETNVVSGDEVVLVPMFHGG
jgi:molybdopterin converting factor small subunit